MRRFDDIPDVVSTQVGYVVKSRSHDGYLALVSGTECSCPAGVAGAQSCRHRKLVAEHVRKLNEKHKRPVAPPHVSALVD